MPGRKTTRGAELGKNRNKPATAEKLADSNDPQCVSIKKQSRHEQEDSSSAGNGNTQTTGDPDRNVPAHDSATSGFGAEAGEEDMEWETFHQIAMGEKDKADQPAGDVEKDKADQPAMSVEKDKADQPAMSVEKDKADQPALSVEKDKADQPAMSVEKDKADQPAISVEKDKADQPALSVEKDKADQPAMSVEKDKADQPAMSVDKDQDKADQPIMRAYKDKADQKREEHVEREDSVGINTRSKSEEVKDKEETAGSQADKRGDDEKRTAIKTNPGEAVLADKVNTNKKHDKTQLETDDGKTENDDNTKSETDDHEDGKKAGKFTPEDNLLADNTDTKNNGEDAQVAAADDDVKIKAKSENTLLTDNDAEKEGNTEHGADILAEDDDVVMENDEAARVDSEKGEADKRNGRDKSQAHLSTDETDAVQKKDDEATKSPADLLADETHADQRQAGKAKSKAEKPGKRTLLIAASLAEEDTPVEKGPTEKPVEATVFDEESHAQPTLFDEESHAQPTLFDEESHAQPILFDEESHAQPTVFDEESHAQPTVFDEESHAQATLFDEESHAQPTGKEAKTNVSITGGDIDGKEVDEAKDQPTRSKEDSDAQEEVRYLVSEDRTPSETGDANAKKGDKKRKTEDVEREDNETADQAVESTEKLKGGGQTGADTKDDQNEATVEMQPAETAGQADEVKMGEHEKHEEDQDGGEEHPDQFSTAKTTKEVPKQEPSSQPKLKRKHADAEKGDNPQPEGEGEGTAGKKMKRGEEAEAGDGYVKVKAAMSELLPDAKREHLTQRLLDTLEEKNRSYRKHLSAICGLVRKIDAYFRDNIDEIIEDQLNDNGEEGDALVDEREGLL